MKVISKQKHTQNTPKLRFPEFSNEWSEQMLGNLFQERTERKAGQNLELLSVTTNHGITRQTSSNKRDISSADKSNYKIVRVGDIVYNTMRMWQGASGLSPYEGFVSPAYTIVSIKTGSSNFYKYLFKQPRVVFNFFRFSQGMTSDTWMLKFDNFSKVVVSVPTDIVEQEKIADFLDSVNSWINSLRLQKSSLELFKLGMIQKIFSQEIRFKDDKGKAYPEWKKRQIGELFDFLPTNSLSRNQLNLESGKIKNIHYGDIHTKFNSHFDISKADVPFINSTVDVSKIKQEFYCIEGDLILADASEDSKDIGKVIELVNLDNQKVVAGLHTILLRKKEPNALALGFSAYAMKTEFVRRQITKIAAGISVLGISKSNLARLYVDFPSAPEQEKITKYLASIDDLIKSLQEQIAQAEQWKKGLMQGLFI